MKIVPEPESQIFYNLFISWEFYHKQKSVSLSLVSNPDVVFICNFFSFLVEVITTWGNDWPGQTVFKNNSFKTTALELFSGVQTVSSVANLTPTPFTPLWKALWRIQGFLPHFLPPCVKRKERRQVNDFKVENSKGSQFFKMKKVPLPLLDKRTDGLFCTFWGDEDGYLNLGWLGGDF